MRYGPFVLAGPQLKLAKTDVPLNAALAQLLAADCQILDISRPTGDLEASLLAVLSAEHEDMWCYCQH